MYNNTTFMQVKIQDFQIIKIKVCQIYFFKTQ